MAAIRILLNIVAVLIIVVGLLWVGQGLGLIMWPRSSFMLEDRKWAVNGSVVAVAGVLALWLLRRRRS